MVPTLPKRRPPQTRRMRLAGIAEINIGEAIDDLYVKPPFARFLLRLDDAMSERAHLLGIFEEMAIEDLAVFAIERVQPFDETEADKRKGR